VGGRKNVFAPLANALPISIFVILTLPVSNYVIIIMNYIKH